MTANVRVRGIYATALTRLLRKDAAGFEIVQPSRPIAERFSIAASVEEYDAAITTTGDRLGVGIDGDPEAVSTLRERLASLAIDAFAWPDDAPREAVFDALVTSTRGGGAVVELGSGEGYLPYDAVDAFVEDGDRYRVQVREPSPPWSDDRPLVDTDVRLDGGDLLTLARESGSGSDARSSPNAGGGSAIGDVTDLLPTDVPDGWRARPTRRADDASFDALDAALAAVATRANALDDAFAAADDHPDQDSDGAEYGPGRVWAGSETVWVRFGRESRFALDDRRRAVTTTMPGHHRIKAGTENASAAVDFAESVCGSALGDGRGSGGNEDDADTDFPFAVATRHFGPQEGDEVAIAHGKPDGREIVLGRGEVSTTDPDGTLVLRREMSSGGTYDAIGTERRAGDVAISRFNEGRWWYQTRYQGTDGETRGTYVNVCTPLELFPDAVRYVDLYVDVVKRPTGEVERVDDGELDAAVADGWLDDALAAKARSVADAIENVL